MLMLIRSALKINLITQNSFIYRRMSVASNKCLINDSQYSFLKDLGLEEVNQGVFDGEWKGSGKVSTDVLMSLSQLSLDSAILKF